MTNIAALKQLMASLARKSPDRAFECEHLQHVTNFALSLGEKRGLDLDLCLVIALAHDMGRLKLGVVGKGHAKAGAKEIKKLLKSNAGLGFSSQEQKLIYHAISVHNQKGKIHGPYDELIKDADAMAHGLEGLLEIGPEPWRVELCKNPGYTLSVKEGAVWEQVLAKEIKSLREHLSHQGFQMEQPDIWVHQTRMAIRKIRSIVWVMNWQEKPKSLEAFKAIAKHLEDARFYYVALSMLPNQGSHRDALRVKLDKEHRKIHQQPWLWAAPVQKPEPDKGDIEPSSTKVLERNGETRCQKALVKYLELAKNVQLDDYDTLHQLRIQGKRLLSWLQADLVTLEPQSFCQVIQDVHHHIGKYRDAVIIRETLHTEALLGLEKHHRRQLKQSLLYLKLRSRDLGPGQ